MVGARRNGALALLVAVGLLFAITVGPATATMPPKSCGTAKVNGHKFKLKVHLISCGRGRKAAIRFLESGDHSKAWDCTRYSPQETKIAFTCRKGSKDYYAIRK